VVIAWLCLVPIKEVVHIAAGRKYHVWISVDLLILMGPLNGKVTNKVFAPCRIFLRYDFTGFAIEHYQCLFSMYCNSQFFIQNGAQKTK